MRKKMSVTQWKKHVLAVTIAIALSANPVWAANNPDSTVRVSGNDKPMFHLNFFNQGNSFNERTSTYTLNQAMQGGLVAGTQYWADILAPSSKNQEAVDIWITTMNEANASAISNPLDSIQSMLLTGKVSDDVGAESRLENILGCLTR